MGRRQKITRVRREYNQWVANQTLEDYALRFTAKSARRWSSLRVANTALGAISFLALEAIGGSITLSWGFANAVPAILVAAALIFATGLPISYYAAKYGVDIDLLTRGAGFGYIGSTITSLIYASFTFIFFAIEAVIMATALSYCFGVPLWIGYIVSSVVVIPLVTHGITFISRFQLWTQPLWILLHVLPFCFIAFGAPESFGDWTGFAGRHESGDARFDLIMFGTAASVVLSLIAQIGEQVDFLRFLPADTGSFKQRLSWWGAMLAGGPGWVVLGTVKLLAGSFLVAFAISQHVGNPGHAAQPMSMYLAAFRYMVPSPAAAVALTGIFVVLSQLKINVTNAYAGSLAWSNFFSRLTRRHPGRVVWLIFNVIIALLLMELGVYEALEEILGLYSSLAAAWVGALVADLVINKPLKLSPPHIEFKRAHLHDLNPVGVGSMLLAVVVAASAYFGLFGAVAQAFTPFIALFVAFVTAPVIAYLTDGRYYLARKSRRSWAKQSSLRCCICENEFDTEDTAYCPAYVGPICSLCCSLDARCGDSCRPAARGSAQLLGLLDTFMPQAVVRRLTSPFGLYLSLVLLLAAIIALPLWAIRLQTLHDASGAEEAIEAAFVRIAFTLLIVGGIVGWLLVLARESRKSAEDETRRQTAMLMQEISAHRRTDAKLQRAKEVAESANLAKSRYVVGISHELRTPLNAVLGYAQLLERDPAIPMQRRDAIRVIRRSGEHLAGLIDGLLDISKIEAGRLQLHDDEVRLYEFLQQIVDMFRLQANTKRIRFVFDIADGLPKVVHIDKKRLRQILINLLSNAIKFTEHGTVTLRVTCRSQVTEIEVQDTGCGIAGTDLKRVFEPFERVERPGVAAIAGMGLGLTITKLLTEIMGGEISVSSTLGEGSLFRVKLLLSEVRHPSLVAAEDLAIAGYEGERRSIVVCDDDDAHRNLMHDVLSPLGFEILAAADGQACIDIVEREKPDLVLLDLTMPGMNGRAVAHALRHDGTDCPAIIVISADAKEAHDLAGGEPEYDAYIVKPLDLQRLLQTIGTLLGLDWVLAPEETVAAAEAMVPPPPQHVAELSRLGRIGYIHGIREKLDAIERDEPQCAAFVRQLRGFVREFDIDRYMEALDALDSTHA